MPRPTSNSGYDAVLLVSFGGPDGPEDVLPFLRNVTRGRNVPPERLAVVARTYERFGGRSPINAHNRALRDALEAELRGAGHDLPVYWGNRNWHPFLRDAVAEMAEAGVRAALAFVTSAFSSYSSCRQYLDDLDAARAEVGPDAPRIDKIRPYFNHPGFVAAWTDAVRAAFAQLPHDRAARARLVFTAHSIPRDMAARCDYEAQLREAARLVAAPWPQVGWDLVWQSRSGPPNVPWLEPDIGDHLETLAPRRRRHGRAGAPRLRLRPHGGRLGPRHRGGASAPRGWGSTWCGQPPPALPPASSPWRASWSRSGWRDRQPVAIGRLPANPHRCPEGCCRP